MNRKPSAEPLPPDDDLPPHLASPEALARWNAEHPEEAKRVEEWMRRLAAGELGDATPEMREAAATFVRSQVGHRSLTVVQAKFRALAELAARPGGTMERTASCGAAVPGCGFPHRPGACCFFGRRDAAATRRRGRLRHMETPA